MKYIINRDTTGPFYITEDEIKLNYNCPDSEKSGEGKGSCGGAEGKGSEKTKSSNFNALKKELETDLIIIKDADFTPENAQGTIDHIDKVIAKLEKDLISGEKYLKEKMKLGEPGRKSVENNNADIRDRISIMKDINTKNKEMLKKEISGRSSKSNKEKGPDKSIGSKSGAAKKITESFGDIQNEATDDFADNMGTKPDDSDILQRGMDMASELNLTGKSAQLYAEKYSKEYDKAWSNAEKDAKAQGFSEKDAGSLKGLREANDKGLISVAGKVKKDFTAGGKSYKKGDYVTRYTDGKWQDEKKK